MIISILTLIISILNMINRLSAMIIGIIISTTLGINFIMIINITFSNSIISVRNLNVLILVIICVLRLLIWIYWTTRILFRNTSILFILIKIKFVTLLWLGSWIKDTLRSLFYLLLIIIIIIISCM